ncbi:MAG TPA: DUF2309 domain-containing protein [Gemmataceae bacterium]|nr:DUF2309 domain-containing protein [Gemmataceae bacterium]
MIERAAHLLPSQGPITVFIHHNTLHAFEDLPFDDAVQKGAQIFGCHPYLTEDRYRQELVRGRIRFADLWEVLREDLGAAAEEKILGLCSRLALRLTMLQYPLHSGPTEELVWYVAETDALRRVRSGVSSAVREQMIAETRHWVLRDLRNSGKDSKANRSRREAFRFPTVLRSIFDRLDESTIESWSEAEWEEFTLRALWGVCCQGVANTPSFAPTTPSSIRHRDLLLAATGTDADLLVHDELIRFCAAFVDQGLARWPLPRRDDGFFRAFSALYGQPGGQPARWLRDVGKELRRLEGEAVPPLESIHESLEILGVPKSEWYDYLAATLLALRGWAGMIRQMELRGDRVAHPAPKGSLLEYVAVRLILDRFALAETARQTLDFTKPLRDLRDEAGKRLNLSYPPAVEPRAFLVFQLAQVFGWTPERLVRLHEQEWKTLLREIETFSTWERRRIFHRAYERCLCTRALDAIAAHAARPVMPAARPRFQAIFCIDEREESFRRHLEEVADDVETESVAGFFHIAMYYRGAADAYFIPLCPVVIRPQQWVAEQVATDWQEEFQRRARTRRLLGTVLHQIHVGTRTFASGALLTGSLGVLASFPLVARILFPRLTARIRQLFGGFVRTPPQTRLQLERGDKTAGPDDGLGFNVDEMTDGAEKLLRDLGLTSGFSRLVLLIGHGSESLNNPYNSAYNCGACGGAAGGPNARAMASILNTLGVRERLAQRGLLLPEDTVFVGGCHNTCTDTVLFFDEDRIPSSHREDFAAAQANLETACERNAHERCRRFLAAPLSLSFSAARHHVEERAEDLGQTRPECGHASNALCIVGRRRTTRGLFLDRRAFLTSYDPAQDDAEHTILTRVLQAVFPVCAGINLEYYFSYVDNTGWGSGTKLPHNIAALVGVMDGAASDLRTGLPLQMVEIHEPVRLLNIIETTPEAMLTVLARDESISRLCRNGWVRLAVLHPTTRQLSIYQNGRFQDYQPQTATLPVAASSADWYRGWRDHLEFAHIESRETIGAGGEEQGHA